MEKWYFPLFAVLSAMLFSCFYNLITTSIPYRKGFFRGCLSDKGQGCHQTSLAAARQSLFTFSVISFLCQGKEMQMLSIETSRVFSLLIVVPHLLSFPLSTTLGS